MRRKRYTKTTEDKQEAKHKSEPLFKLELPEVKPIPMALGASIFGGLTVIGLGIGAAIGTQLFFGTVALAGMIAICETNRYAKYVVIHGSLVIDMAIFLSSLYALAVLGPTIAGGLTVAGLGFTLVYTPNLRKRYKGRKHYVK